MNLKVIAITDFFLILALLSVFAIGSLDKKNRILSEIKNNHRISLNLYDSQTMKFEQDIFTERAKKNGIKSKLPNITIAIINIPANTSNIHSIFGLPSFIALGFKHNVDQRTLNISSYSGHKTIAEIYVSKNCGNNNDYCIDLRRSDSENILLLNKLISSDYLNGFYIRTEELFKLKGREYLIEKIKNSGAIIIGDTNICYKERICNFDTIKDAQFASNSLNKILELSKKDLWLITFEYNANVVEYIYDFLSKYHDI